MSLHAARLAAAVAVVLALAWAAESEALARRNPEDVFAGRILASKTRFPTAARSASAYIQKLKNQSRTNFWEDEKVKGWRIYFAAFFAQPLDDVEVTVKLWDVTGGAKQMLVSFEQYLERRGQRSLISDLKLLREEFGVNKRILMTVENRGRVLARATFRLEGAAERLKGRVDFAADEAAP